MRVNLGQFLIFMAAVEVVAMWAMLRALPEDATAEQRSARRIILVAAVVSGIGLCLAGLFVPSLSEIRLI